MRGCSPTPHPIGLKGLEKIPVWLLIQKIALSMASYRDSKHNTGRLEITERFRVEIVFATDRDLARGPRNTLNLSPIIPAHR